MFEVTLSLGLFMILMGASYTLITSAFSNQMTLINKNNAVEDSKKSVLAMTRNIREAQDGDDGSYPIELANDFSIVFYSDVDIDNSVERIRYFVQNETLKMGVTESAGNPLVYNTDVEVVSTVVSDVKNETKAVPLFRYYGNDYPSVTTPLVTPANLQAVMLVEIRLLINTSSKLTEDSEIDSFVQVRNVKSNL